MPDQSDAVGTIKTIRRYAVKSMGAEELEESLVTEGGLLGDRGYALIDAENGKIGSAKMPTKWGGLLALHASFTEPPKAGEALPPVQIDWPNGDSVTSDSDDVDARLSATVGRAARLTTIRPEVISLERLDPLADEEVILDIGEIMMAGRFSDYAAIHMLTTASLARLSEIRPDVSFDAGRFRPNLVIAGARAWAEDDWSAIGVGELAVDLVKPCDRCVVINTDQGTGAVAPEPLQVLATFRRREADAEGGGGAMFGVNGVHSGTGTLRVGDSVEVLA